MIYRDGVDDASFEELGQLELAKRDAHLHLQPLIVKVHELIPSPTALVPAHSMKYKEKPDKISTASIGLGKKCFDCTRQLQAWSPADPSLTTSPSILRSLIILYIPMLGCTSLNPY